MSKKKFTEAEIAILRENPYTLAVTPDRITYTREFKQLFWADYQKRMRLSAIFRKYGYDPAMLGRGRLTGLQQSLKKEFEAGLEFHGGKRPRGARKNATAAKDPNAVMLRKIQREIDHLEQEIGFLMKIFSLARANAKKSKPRPKKSTNGR